MGYHGLFPLQRRPNAGIHAIRLVSAMGPGHLMRKVADRIRRNVHPGDGHLAPRNPIWLFRPLPAENKLSFAGGMQLAASWSDLVCAVEREQAGKRNVQVVVYPCAPLQCLEAPAAGHPLADAHGSLLEMRHISIPNRDREGAESLNCTRKQ
jgi:hypothetical protein